MGSQSKIMGWGTQTGYSIIMALSSVLSWQPETTTVRVCLLLCLLSVSLRGLRRLLNTRAAASVCTAAMQTVGTCYIWRGCDCVYVLSTAGMPLFAWMSSFFFLPPSRTGQLAFQSAPPVSYERSPYLKMIHPLELVWVSERGRGGGCVGAKGVKR